MDKLRNHGYKVLLVCLLLLLILGPLEGVRKLVQTGLFCTVLFASLIRLNPKKHITFIALGLALITAIMWSLAQLYDYPTFNAPTFHLVSIATAIGFLCLVTYFILVDTFQFGQINADKLCGAVCLYLLIGLIFSVVYQGCMYIDPNSLLSSVVQIDLSDQRVEGVVTYYSFVTLSTLGYGDIYPGTTTTKTIAWMEAMIGQIYLTILVARLVGLHIAQQTVELSSAELDE